MIRPGSSTDLVLAVLVKRFPAFLNLGQIKAATSCTHGSLAWAIAYLKAQKLIECTADDSRNPRYSRYRVTSKGIDYAANRNRL